MPIFSIFTEWSSSNHYFEHSQTSFFNVIRFFFPQLPKMLIWVVKMLNSKSLPLHSAFSLFSLALWRFCLQV